MCHAKPQVRDHRHNSDSRKGHGNIRSSQAYLHAHMALKEKALARTAPAHATAGRYRPPDSLLAFLEQL